MQLHRYWMGSSTSIIPCHWKSWRFHAGRKRCLRPGCSHGQFLLTLHPLRRGCLQSKLGAVNGKAVVRWTIRDRVCPPPLHNTLVRPHLECSMQACSPNMGADADRLEQIQRLATRLVKGFRRLPYEVRLRLLCLHSFSRRNLSMPNVFWRIGSGP